ncbi:hypothetical protein OWV82_008145 [Melia azedarach]|uniref:Uncharacterized protein n=1 Tax=Melia azedarach TaxID=155640 RepID=A0ACC1YB21_MELAZ|nr:hypothetical protein OWV82_008145 [Melia azedarach]
MQGGSRSPLTIIRLLYRSLSPEPLKSFHFHFHFQFHSSPLEDNVDFTTSSSVGLNRIPILLAGNLIIFSIIISSSQPDRIGITSSNISSTVMYSVGR